MPLPDVPQPRSVLGSEDFQRLGVRPFEYRLSVIRQAVARSSQPLAKKQLTTPSAQTGLQLARVATSAYRMMDPRQRMDLHQRIQVGRILPNTLRWAGRTKFYNAGTTTSPAVEPYEGDELTDEQLIEILDLDSPGELASPVLPEPWTEKLRDQDLLASTPMGRRIARWKSRLRHPVVWMGTGGLVVGTLLGLFSLTIHDASKPTVPTAVTEVPKDAVSGVPQTPTVVPLDPIPNDISPPPNAPLEVSPEPPVDPSPVPPSSEQLSPLDLSSMDSVAENPMPEPEGTVGSSQATESEPMVEPAIKVTPRSEASDLASNDSVPPMEPFLTDPFESLEDSPRSAVPSPESATVPPMDVTQPPLAGGEPSEEPAEIPGASLHLIPDEASVRRARSSLLKLFPDMQRLPAVDDAPKQISELKGLVADLDSGSADHWVASVMIGKLAWISGSRAEVVQALDPFVGAYDDGVWNAGADGLQLACQQSPLPEVQEHLLREGLVFVDQLITNEAYAQSENSIDSLMAIAQTLESNSSLDYLDSFRQAVTSARRLQKTAGPALGTESQNLTERELGAVARYRCMILRRWKEGLPGLVHLSDSRISTAAKKELELTLESSPDDWSTVANRWLTTADRSSGRSADSMRLHGVTLVFEVVKRSSGLQKLETERQLEELLEELPPYLKPTAQELVNGDVVASQATTSPSRPGNPQVATSENAKPQNATTEANDSASGLVGRILVAGTDIGVQLNYEHGMSFEEKLIDTIKSRSDEALDSFQIVFSGTAKIDEPALMLIELSDFPTQAFFVDDQPVELDPLTGGAITLKPGLHAVRWTISVADSTPLSRCYLRLSEAIDGKTIRLKRPTGDQPATRMTVEMVRGKR